MTANIIEFPRTERNDTEMQAFAGSLPLSFRNAHCEPARRLLGWSIEALAFRSGVSIGAIERVERGEVLREVTMQALAFALEKEGLIFFAGHAPLRGANCRGATADPKARDDYHLLE
ncbi:TPA: helix-turn-helix domain-containing protein [Pseudomonas putida]|uniref:helix-turn-helix domain-containing protein n=1 Tax=Pseudomonas sp. TaxID=306 RepID=UPI0028A59314|nr:helix-turn-helix transcriptional regulator [Pseudomonas sp.]